MKKIYVLPLIAFLIALTGCKVVCEAEKVVSEHLSGAIATGLNCKNQAAIQLDVSAILDRIQTCPTDEGKMAGTIAQIVCPIVSSAAVAFLGNKVPVTWQCDLSNAQANVASVITNFCSRLPF